jgi:hypothetical protein
VMLKRILAASRYSSSMGAVGLIRAFCIIIFASYRTSL